MATDFGDSYVNAFQKGVDIQAKINDEARKEELHQEQMRLYQERGSAGSGASGSSGSGGSGSGGSSGGSSGDGGASVRAGLNSSLNGGGGGSNTGGMGTPPGNTAVIEGITPTQRAFLDTLGQYESTGKYNIRYNGKGGTTFDLSGNKHPNIAVPTPDGEDTASSAGRYQFTGKTWRAVAKNYGITDFSPVNQDKAALLHSADVYKRNTGRNLWTDLESNKFDPKALNKEWTSVPGGVEGHGRTGVPAAKWFGTYNAALAKAKENLGSAEQKAMEKDATLSNPKQVDEAPAIPKQMADAAPVDTAPADTSATAVAMNSVAPPSSTGEDVASAIAPPKALGNKDYFQPPSEDYTSGLKAGYLKATQNYAFAPPISGDFAPSLYDQGAA
jgi:muramidase (phage lysozyme)